MTGAKLLDFASKGAVVLVLLACALGGFFIGRRDTAGRQASGEEETEAEQRRAASDRLAAEQERTAVQAVLNYDEAVAYGIASPMSGTGNTSE